MPIEVINGANGLGERQRSEPALATAEPIAGDSEITASSLGSADFREDYHIKYAYLAGAMYKGIASKELVVAMGKSGLMAYLGAGGLDFDEIESAISHIRHELTPNQSYGVNLLCNLERPDIEERTVELFFRYGVQYAEAAAFLQVTPSVVLYRCKDLKRNSLGVIESPVKILVKVSRPEVAAMFMQPAPETILRSLVERGRITPAQAELGRQIPVCDDICVEADSGGHTDGGVAYALMPAMIALRDEMMKKYRYPRKIRIGAAGGIGTPEAAAASFIMGADFILTGSINQCTVEAGTSDAVKDILQGLCVQDTDYAPAGDMFELGAKVQVVKKGLFFAARANKLYDLYQRFNSIVEIDERTRSQIQEKYFKRSFETVWEETRQYYLRADPKKLEEVERNPKQKMALIFRWYFVHTTRLAMEGSTEQRVDYQVHCGPAMGSFNQWVKGTELEPWRNRHVADIAERLMQCAASLLNGRLRALSQPAPRAIAAAATAAGVRAVEFRTHERP